MKALVNTSGRVHHIMHFYLLPFIFFLALSSAPCALCQTPQGFTYQALAIDGAGEPIRNQALPVRITIQSDTLGGTIFWYEEHAGVTTNATGLFTLVVGKGSKISGTATTFADIDWSVTPKYIKTEILDGTWQSMGSSRLWSVPYAMTASGLTGSLPTIDVTGSSRIGNHQLSHNAIEVNNYGTGNRLAAVDLHGDDTYTDFALRIIRTNTGPDAYSSIQHRGLGLFNIATLDAAPLSFITANSHRMRITETGNVGIGISSPAYKLDVVGEITARNTYAFRLRNTTYGVILRNDNERFWLIPTAENDPDGSIGTLRPMSIFLGTGNVHLGYNRLNVIHGGNVGIATLTPADPLEVAGAVRVSSAQGHLRLWHGSSYGVMGTASNTDLSLRTNDVDRVRVTNTGNVGIGATTPGGRLTVQTPAGWDDNTPLFEVKNKLGVPVFAVYNYGVRILVDHTTSKAVKGGFAIGGFDESKAGETVTLMLVSPDSIRFNINNSTAKAVKGGFGIGGFDESKGSINEDFMYLTPEGSTAGISNVRLGFEAGKNAKGMNNTFIGYQAGYSKVNSNAAANIFIGEKAGFNNVGGYSVTWDPFYGPKITSWGGTNVCIGYNSGRELYGTVTTGAKGENNLMLGHFSGSKQTTSSGNVFVGNHAGESNITGTNNVYLGNYAGEKATGSNNVIIGNYAGDFLNDESGLFVLQNLGNILMYGNFGTQKLTFTADVGISTTSPTQKLDVNGNARFRVIASDAYAGVLNRKSDGTLTTSTSDIRMKENIHTLSNSLNRILQLRGVSFTWKSEPELGTRIGMIAQEVETVFPELVFTNEFDGYKGIQYSEVSAVLVEAMKEQQHIIVSLEEKIRTQQTELETLRTEMESIKALLLREIK